MYIRVMMMIASIFMIFPGWLTGLVFNSDKNQGN